MPLKLYGDLVCIKIHILPYPVVYKVLFLCKHSICSNQVAFKRQQHWNKSETDGNPNINKTAYSHIRHAQAVLREEEKND